MLFRSRKTELIRQELGSLSPLVRRQVEEAITADEVALLAQDMGYAVSGSDILRFNGQSASGVRVTRIDHPGEYPGRYV
mgnify:CR=1 FL=1